jgi:tight adherence protein B
MAEKPVAFEALASVIQRLGAAGRGSHSSLGLALPRRTRGPQADRIRAVARRRPGGTSVTTAILETGVQADQGDAAWRGLAAAWQVATEAGASLAPTLNDFAASLRDLAQNERDARTALAGPGATARMIVLLPIVGVLFGLALGFDTLGTLFTTPPGIACLVGGVLLMLVSRWWTRRLLRGAKPSALTPGLGLELVAIAVAGGAALPRALATVELARQRCGIADDDADTAIAGVLALSSRAGVPAVALLRSEATGARRLAKSEGERRSATLAITLMLPLGICVLPAFMLLGVAPLLISIISSTVGSI